jgi:transcriptional regulator with PAS, ATPase and Fis domain
MIHWQPGMTLEEVEKQVILKAFQFYNRNKTHTAKALDIAIRTLDSKLEKYALPAQAGIRVEPAEKVS